MTPRILVAGLGNIFFGDDGFGCEVVRQLARKPMSENVRVIDFGIRSYDLAYTLTSGFSVAILVDAVMRGQPPGTIFVIEPEEVRGDGFENTIPDAHSLDPFSVLQMAKAIGSLPEKLVLVGCEPAVLDSDDMSLSEPVRAAIPLAISEIESLVSNISTNQERSVCLVADGKGKYESTKSSHSVVDRWGNSSIRGGQDVPCATTLNATGT